MKIIYQKQNDYMTILQKMHNFTISRKNETEDEIWILEHNPIFTLGKNGNINHLLSKTNIPIIKTNRGGQITYHGPGQIIAYLLLNLKKKKITIRQFIKKIEESIIQTLSYYNISSIKNDKYPGVYVYFKKNIKKIASIGLKILNGYTYHGLSLNVKMDLKPFEIINTCGIVGLKSIDMFTLNVNEKIENIKYILSKKLYYYLK